MQETILITKAEIQQYKQLSNSINQSKLEQIIKEAQFNDLRPLLGERLYNDVMTKVEASSTDYDDLMNGSVYEFGGITYTN